MENKVSTQLVAGLPIKEFKEAIVGLAAIAVFGVDFARTKNFDFPRFMTVLGKVQAGIDNYGSIIPQGLDIDSAEGLEVVAAVTAELNLPDGKAKNVVLALVEGLPANIKLVQAIIA